MKYFHSWWDGCDTRINKEVEIGFGDFLSFECSYDFPCWVEDCKGWRGYVYSNKWIFRSILVTGNTHTLIWYIFCSLPYVGRFFLQLCFTIGFDPIWRVWLWNHSSALWRLIIRRPSWIPCCLRAGLGGSSVTHTRPHCRAWKIYCHTHTLYGKYTPNTAKHTYQKHTHTQSHPYGGEL